MTLSTRIQNSVEFIRSRTDAAPTIGLILGSGLGDFADTLQDRLVIPFTDIPDFPAATVPGHTGAFVFGTSHGKSVVCLQGRLLYYEGHPMSVLTMPVRIMAKLGVKTLVLTNAAGGVNKDYRPGDLMLITDHINYSGMNPLIGEHLEEFGPRFQDLSAAYTPALREVARQTAIEQGITLREGVYMYFPGPHYESPAEVRASRILGADAVGMSTVPEVIVAAHCGMQVLGFSLCTNMAAGVNDVALDGDEVIAAGQDAMPRFANLLRGCLSRL